MARYTITQERKCQSCKGSGKHYVEEDAEMPEHFSMSSAGYNHCNVCNGSGKIFMEISITEREIEDLYTQMMKDRTILEDKK